MIEASSPSIPRIHHITAICGHPQWNIDFYVGLLGLRLVKKTVNFDDRGSYHLYYGDGLGTPGTIMRYGTGALEVSGAVLLLMPALAGVGALLLASVMLGAIFSHLFVIGGSPAMPLVWLAVIAIIAYGRRERTLRLLGR